MKQKIKRKRPILVHASWLPFGLRGFCLPPLVAVRMDKVSEPWVLRHELAHWVQYKRRGWMGYVSGYLWHYLKRGYDLHPWEKEARRRGWKPRSRAEKPCFKCQVLFEKEIQKLKNPLLMKSHYLTAQNVADLQECSLGHAYRIHRKIRDFFTPADMRRKSKLTLNEYARYFHEDEQVLRRTFSKISGQS